VATYQGTLLAPRWTTNVGHGVYGRRATRVVELGLRNGEGRNTGKIAGDGKGNQASAATIGFNRAMRLGFRTIEGKRADQESQGRVDGGPDAMASTIPLRLRGSRMVPGWKK
jgi:hypothetical protein